jgi:hypothetical protein
VRFSGARAGHVKRFWFTFFWSAVTRDTLSMTAFSIGLVLIALLYLATAVVGVVWFF